MFIFPSFLEDRCSSTYWLPIKTDELDGILSCQRETSCWGNKYTMLNSVCGEQRNRIVGHCND